MPMLETERRGRVLVVSVDNPPHNFMTAEMVRELSRLVRSLRGDRSLGAVVITGKPDGLYITHYDVAEILASVERAGHGGAALADRRRPADRGGHPADAGAARRRPSGHRWPRSSSSTGSTTSSWR